MKYNADFVAAVYAVQTHVGESAAVSVFNKLFDVPQEDRLAVHLAPVVPFVKADDVRAVISRVGAPEYVGAVTWIRALREEGPYGLKEAKDAYDLLRNNPSLCT